MLPEVRDPGSMGKLKRQEMYEDKSMGRNDENKRKTHGLPLQDLGGLILF